MVAGAVRNGQSLGVEHPNETRGVALRPETSIAPAADALDNTTNGLCSIHVRQWSSM